MPTYKMVHQFKEAGFGFSEVYYREAATLEAATLNLDSVKVFGVLFRNALVVFDKIRVSNTENNREATIVRVSYAQTITPAIWLCQYRTLSWALAHIRAKYQLSREQVACYQCRLPSSWVLKLNRGIWICYRDIPTERLEMVST